MTANPIANLLAGLLAAGAAGFFLYRGMSMDPDAANFPILVASVLGALVLLLAVQEGLGAAMRWKTDTGAGPVPGPTAGAATRTLRQQVYPFVLVGFCLIFLITLERIGFEISAIALMISAMFLFNRNETIRKSYITVITTAAMILLFNVLLGLRVPMLFSYF